MLYAYLLLHTSMHSKTRSSLYHTCHISANEYVHIFSALFSSFLYLALQVNLLSAETKRILRASKNKGQIPSMCQQESCNID